MEKIRELIDDSSKADVWMHDNIKCIIAPVGQWDSWEDYNDDNMEIVGYLPKIIDNNSTKIVDGSLNDPFLEKEECRLCIEEYFSEKKSEEQYRRDLLKYAYQ